MRNEEEEISIQNLTNETPETMNAFHNTDLWILYVLRSALMWLKPEHECTLDVEDEEMVLNISECILLPYSDDCPHTGDWYAEEMPIWQRIYAWAVSNGDTWLKGLKFLLGIVDRSVRQQVVDLLRRVNPVVLDEITVFKSSRWQLFVHYDVDGERQAFPRSEWNRCAIARKHHSIRGTRGGPVNCSMDIWSHASYDGYVPVTVLMERLADMAMDVKVYLDFDDDVGRELVPTTVGDPIGPISHAFSKVWLSESALDEILYKMKRISVMERNVNPFFHPGEGLVKTVSPTVEIYLLSEWIVLEG
jgi:hypothetical protein